MEPQPRLSNWPGNVRAKLGVLARSLVGCRQPSHASMVCSRIPGNLDIWAIVALQMRGHGRSLSACAATCRALRAIVLPELYRSIYLGARFDIFRKLLETGTVNVSYIRRVHVDDERALCWFAAALANPVAEISSHAQPLHLTALQELRVSRQSWLDNLPLVISSFGACLSSIVVLEVTNTLVTSFEPLRQLAASFPRLHTLRLHSISQPHSANRENELNSARSLFRLKDVFCTDCIFQSPSWTTVLDWRLVEMLGIEAASVCSVWPALLDARAQLRRLYIHNMPSHASGWDVPHWGRHLSPMKSMT
jgi:hypothetical protein